MGIDQLYISGISIDGSKNVKSDCPARFEPEFNIFFPVNLDLMPWIGFKTNMSLEPILPEFCKPIGFNIVFEGIIAFKGRIGIFKLEILEDVFFDADASELHRPSIDVRVYVCLLRSP